VNVNDPIDDKQNDTAATGGRSARAAEKARRIEEMRTAKAAKEAAKAQAKAESLAAKAAAKQPKAPKPPKEPKQPKAPKEPKQPKAPKEPKQPKAPKEPKDPYRPRFAVAPTPVRVFTVLAWLMAFVAAAGAALASLAASGSLEIDLPDGVDGALLYGLAATSALSALLWVAAAVKVSTGFRSGVILGAAAAVFAVLSPAVAAFPLLLASVVALLARDTRDWAIDVKD
jgi:hypothetical protein